MSQRLNNLNNIVSNLWGGAEIYRKAARATEKPQHEEVFLRHAVLREETARELSRLIDEAGGQPATAAASEKAYGLLTQLGTLFNDTDDALIRGLEEHEDRTLSVFREAVNHPDNHRDEDMLRAMMEQFEQSHAKMREWKIAS